jgi:hypothetical protein
MKKLYLIILVFLFGFMPGDVVVQFRDLTWEFNKTIDFEGKARNILYFNGCQIPESQSFLPYFVECLKLDNNRELFVDIVDPVFIKLTDKKFRIEEGDIPETLKISRSLEKSGNEYYLKLQVLPFKKINGEIFLLKSFGMKLKSGDIIPEKKSAFAWKSESVLKSGHWVKIKTAIKGVHRIPYSRLSEWGFTNPQNVHVFGNSGYMLPENNGVKPTDELTQISLWKGKDNAGNDCLFFYSTGNTKWDYDEGSTSFKHTLNVYSRSTYYFLTEDAGVTKEVTPFSPIDTGNNLTVNSVDDFLVYETEKSNLLKSGRQWFGERFISGTISSFSIDCPGRKDGTPVRFDINAAARSSINSSMTVSINGYYATEIDFDTVDTGSETTEYASEKGSVVSFSQAGELFDLKLAYTAIKDNVVNSSAEAWLDYIRVNYRRNLNYLSPEMYFRDTKSIGGGNIAKFEVGNCTASLKVFDVTGITDIYEVPTTLNGALLSFKRPTNELHEYVIFSPSTSFPEPEKVGEVSNQNLHALSVPEMIIITHPSFSAVANELADFHRTKDGMSVEVVKSTEVYNEFGSGMADASSIRNFIKMLYEKDNTTLKYVLLLGDGSYDNRNLNDGSKNFIPTYESVNSLSATGSFVTDDYFVILDNSETVYDGAVDLGIGRIPASSVYEAQIVLNKIKNYYSPEALGAWRNTVCFIADDEDQNLHMSDSEDLTNKINKEHKAFLTSKIYFDAYPQETTPAGDLYPRVTELINERVSEGVLILNYVGHANDRYLAKEHVLDVSNINAWSNKNNLPIFVTATCEFSRFDSDETSAGEYILLNPNGGGIGLFSTTRVAYAYSNSILSKSFYSFVFNEDKNGNHYRMGDVIRLAKINTFSSINMRIFMLFADPALQLSYPKYKVITSKVNSKDASLVTDTVKALNKITVEGYIADYNGNKLTGFNGDISPVVYDKAFMMKTLGNAGQFPFEFKVQDNIIYKGLASVVNGSFSFSFIVPKDISYSLGNGKIVYYAQNGTDDANGSFENFLIGGSTEGQFSDRTGPEVNLYLDDKNFVSGNKTSKNPLLLAFISDENGINTVGAGVGHDITAVIDDDVKNIYILNDYYKADIDDYKSGEIEFPFKNLAAGEHTLKLKVWDVANNSSETEIKFVVTGDFYISEVGNYPNPVSGYTYFRFTHNQPDATFNGLVEIFDRSGKLVDSFTTIISSTGMESNPVRWNLSDAKVPLSAGIYIYRISIKAADGAITWKSGKMSVIY